MEGENDPIGLARHLALCEADWSGGSGKTRTPFHVNPAASGVIRRDERIKRLDDLNIQGEERD